MKNKYFYDVVIVGAGPSGSNAAISYKNLNPDLKVAIFDKAHFPRDKSCGDAIGPGVISALKRFNNEHILKNDPEVVSTTLFFVTSFSTTLFGNWYINTINKIANNKSPLCFLIRFI